MSHDRNRANNDESRYGTVFLMDSQWVKRNYKYVVLPGTIAPRAYVNAERARADWFITVKGETTTFNIFGCQVRAVLEHDRERPVLGEVCVLP